MKPQTWYLRTNLYNSHDNLATVLLFRHHILKPHILQCFWFFYNMWSVFKIFNSIHNDNAIVSIYLHIYLSVYLFIYMCQTVGSSFAWSFLLLCLDLWGYVFAHWKHIHIVSPGDGIENLGECCEATVQKWKNANYHSSREINERERYMERSWSPCTFRF